MIRPALSVALAAALVACAPGADPDEPGEHVPVGGFEENDPRWHAVVRDIAEGYTEWLRVEEAVRWAPELCHLPLVHARFSESGTHTPHGSKLYTLWAKDPVAYGAQPTHEMWASALPVARRLAPLEQVIVKEAYQPVELELREDGTPVVESWPSLGPAERGGRWYGPGAPAGLFIMFRPADAVAPTDEGWVYAAVEPDGEITGAGRMASCMSCHTEQADRLFGLPDDA